ncbi:MAG: c-type cytochrome [Pirellulaceae bacterium]
MDQTEQWLKLVTAVPFNTLGVEAAKILVSQHKLPAIQSAIEQADEPQAAAAVSALGYVNELAARDSFVDHPRYRAQSATALPAAAALGRSEAGQQALLEMAQTGQVTEDIQFAVTDALLGSAMSKSRTLPPSCLPPATATSEAIPPIQELAKRRGNAEAGQQVFTTTGTCSKCHKVHGEGKEIGPDLSEIGSKLAREDMFLAILNPVAAVSHNYETYTLLTADGQVLTGLLMNQNDQSLTIRNAEGIDTTVERAMSTT